MVESRVAVVTGAGRGIGAAIADRLASDGMALACLDVDEAAAGATAARLAGRGVPAQAFAADVSDEAAVARVVAEVAERLGPPTVLVNNAGVLRDNLLFKMTAMDWDTVMAVHLRGTFLMTREVQQHMTAASYGRIVNLSSTSALGNRGQANYAAAKAGLQGFTRTVAQELGRFGITCNAVAPGFIVTEMTAKMPFGTREVGSRINSLQQGGLPVDVAETIAWLSQPGSGGVNGQVVRVCGQSLLGA